MSENMAHLLAQLDAVRELHIKSAGHNPLCDCGIAAGAGPMCNECREEWPCPTIQAITGEGGMAKFQDALGDYYDGGMMGEKPKRGDYGA